MSIQPEITVLRQGTEGLSIEEYAQEIRDRLPEYTVRRARTPHEERRLVEQSPIITGVGIDEQILTRANNLKLFACAYSGTGHLPEDLLLEREIRVTNASGIHAPGIAEQAVGNIIVFSRRLHEGWHRKQKQEWRHYQASELTDATVTILGLGSIGTGVARRFQGFGVNTIGIRSNPEKGGPTDEVMGTDQKQFHEALSRTDYLVIACPLTDATRGLVGKEELITLPPDAVIVNTARGAIIDTDALQWAIQNGCLRGAALDVTDPEPLPDDHPLWGFENVLITPHMGGHTPEHWPRLADILAENVRRLEDGDNGLRNQVLP